MNDGLSAIEKTVLSDYKYGFVTDIEADAAPKGLNEDIIRFISAKKGEPEWMLEWRLKGYRAWLEMEEVDWAKLTIPEIDFEVNLTLETSEQALLKELQLALANA